MERRWYKVWPMWVPKSLEVDKPASEYIREWATVTPERIAVSFYGQGHDVQGTGWNDR